MENKILLISYVFPPYPGIGGRRWAKFARYFAQQGIDVFVIAASNPFIEQSNWLKDIQHDKINISYLPSRYPSILLRQPASLQQKLHYKFTDAVMKAITPGNHYDRACFWEKEVLQEANRLISKHTIRNVIVTGAPFKVLHIGTKIKKLYPEINLIADYRDPWNNNLFWNYSQLSKRKKKHELLLEAQVLQSSDYILTVSEAMTQHLRNKVKETEKSRFLTIPNGFDESELAPAPLTEEADNIGEKIKLVFAGSLYDHLEYIFFPFIEALHRLKEEKPALYKRLEIHFYTTSMAHQYLSYMKRFTLEVIHVHPPVPVQEAHLKIKTSDYVLLFLNKDLTYSMSTKFFEYIAYKKPILVFSDPGELPDFVVQHHIGLHFTPEGIQEQLSAFILRHTDRYSTYYQDFDTSIYSLQNQAEKIKKILKPSDIQEQQW